MARPGKTEPALDALTRGLQAGRTAALGRALTLVESGEAEGLQLLERLRSGEGTIPATGIPRPSAEGPGAPAPRPHRIGLTGPPGAGKSSLARELARLLLARGGRVAILAVDPSSLRSGGALLGDRIRLGALAAHPKLFVRSLATRGAPGGTARPLGGCLELLERVGFTHLLVETAGVGQVASDLGGIVNSVVVVLVPGQGDAVQAMKGGLLETADIVVLQKADLPGVDRLEQELREGGLLPSDEGGRWAPPILRTRADEGEGIEALAEALDAHRSAGGGRHA